MNLNKVILIGRITIDPQIKTTTTGQSVCSFSVATNRVWNDKNGQRQEDTEFHNVVTWGKQAEIAGRFLTKGAMVMIEGRLKTRTWQDNQGQNRRTTEIICEGLQLGPKPGNISGGYSPAANHNQNPQNSSNSSLAGEGSDNTKKEEDLPTINMDGDSGNNDNNEINDDDLPF